MTEPLPPNKEAGKRRDAPRAAAPAPAPAPATKTADSPRDTTGPVAQVMGCGASSVKPEAPDPGPAVIAVAPRGSALIVDGCISTEALRVLSQLDEQRLIKVLLALDIRLLCREWLLAQPNDYRLERRQVLEELQKKLEREESTLLPFLSGQAAVELIRNAAREVGALSYGWLLPTDADPTGERLAILKDALKKQPHIKALFIDQATLYQPPRSSVEDEAFGRALEVMGDLYASAVGTTVLQLKEIPPRPADFDGVLCLGQLSDGVGEEQIRAALGGFGQIERCELDVHPGARVTFATHNAAMRAAAAELPSCAYACAAAELPICAYACVAWNDRPYDDIDTGGKGRGWCVFEGGVSVELTTRLESYPKMKAVLDKLPPKVLALSSKAPPTPVVVKETDGHVARLIAKIEKATFTGPGDKSMVIGIYKEFVERITRVLTSTLKIATVEPTVQLPPMPAGGENELRAWHVDCLRVQHASIPDALSGRQLDTLRDCVPIAITGKDTEGRPLAGVRDAKSLAGWLQQQQLAAGEGALVTAEPAAGKTWLLSQV